jgi:hypothetical protein
MQFLGRPPPRVQALAARRRPSQRGAFVVPTSPISLAAAEIGADVWLLVVAAAISVGLAVGSYEVSCALTCSCSSFAPVRACANALHAVYLLPRAEPDHAPVPAPAEGAVAGRGPVRVVHGLRHDSVRGEFARFAEHAPSLSRRPPSVAVYGADSVFMFPASFSVLRVCQTKRCATAPASWRPRSASV